MADINLSIADSFGASALGQKFAIYVPNQDSSGRPIDQERWVDAALHLFSELFGGATAQPYLKGAWLNPKTKQLIIEEPQLVYSYVRGEVFVQHIEILRNFMTKMGRETRQGQIGFEFDGTFFLIDIE